MLCFSYTIYMFVTVQILGLQQLCASSVAEAATTANVAVFTVSANNFAPDIHEVCDLAACYNLFNTCLTCIVMLCLYEWWCGRLSRYLRCSPFLTTACNALLSNCTHCKAYRTYQGKWTGSQLLLHIPVELHMPVAIVYGAQYSKSHRKVFIYFKSLCTKWDHPCQFKYGYNHKLWISIHVMTQPVCRDWWDQAGQGLCLKSQTHWSGVAMR